VTLTINSAKYWKPNVFYVKQNFVVKVIISGLGVVNIGSCLVSFNLILIILR
jgi:hypothetical protein